MSAGTRRVYDSVEDALYSVGHHNTAIPLKTQAARLGMSAGKLTDYVDPNRKPRFPADLVAPHAIAAEDFAAVQTICKLAGGVFIQLPTGVGDARQILESLGSAIKEAGDVALNIAADLADGKIDKRANALEEIDQAIAAFASLRELIDQTKK